MILSSSLPTDHPVLHLEPWLSREDVQAEFSSYAYQPDSLDDSRRVHTFQGGPDWLSRFQALLAELRSGEELAIHSNVLVGGELFHLPMVDFGAKELGEPAMARLRCLLPELGGHPALYETDRSWHAYGQTLLPADGMVGFLARLLLVDKPGDAPIVDARWIGHRLLAGRMALRVSAHGGRHAFAPRRRDPD